MTVEQNLQLFEKTTFDEIVAEWTDEAGAAINISTYTALMKVLNPDGSVALAMNSTDVSGDRLIKVDAAGSVQPYFSDDHPLLKGVAYTYDLILYKDGETRRLMRGLLTVKEARTLAP